MAVSGLIDCHAHHYPQAYLDACHRHDSGLDTYLRDDGRLVVLQDGAVSLAAPQPLPSLEQRLRAMDDAGIEMQLLSVSAPNVYRFPRALRLAVTREVNDELLALAHQSGGRLQVLASLPLPDVDDALAELERVMRAPTVRGVFLCTTIDRRTLDDPALDPLLAELSRRELAVHVHPTTPCSTDGVREYALALALDYLAETTNAIARLAYSGTFDRHPGIRWVFSHLGGTTPFLIHRFDNYFRQFPECREKIDRPPSEILRRVFFDTVTTHAPAMRCALETFDAGQFVFGTDYPHVPGGMRPFAQLVDELVPEDRLEEVRRGTAMRVFGIDDPVNDRVEG
ncbi:MAG TPA: amidohydrolase family protein [Conexibacter sp.]|jgi:aminocarboxymuconate-semialdehyde decarboxylase